MNKNVVFLNCNFPNNFKIPKGKPKGLKSILEIKRGKLTLIQEKENKIWLKEDSYYFGIEFPIIYNALGIISEYQTIGNINIALMDWQDNHLSAKEEELLYKYLKIIQ